MSACAVCGATVRAKRSTRRYCDPACHKRAQRARQNGHVTLSPGETTRPLA